MSSVEKKEIIQNGIFGTFAGLVMGGPIGAGLAAGTAIGLGILEETRDEELRQKEWERKHADPIDTYNSRKNVEAKVKNRSDSLKRIDNLIKLNNDYEILHSVEIHPDPYRINRERFNSHGHCILTPDKAPYVLISIFEAERFGRVWIQKECITKESKGELLDINEFEKSLSNDISNSNIIKYIILHGSNYLYDTGVKYLYSIDNGRSFKLCYKSI